MPHVTTVAVLQLLNATRAFLLGAGLAVSVTGHAQEGVPHPEIDLPGREREAEREKGQDESKDNLRLKGDSHFQASRDEVGRWYKNMQLQAQLEKHPVARFLADFDGQALRPTTIKPVWFGVKTFGNEFVEGSKAPETWLEPRHLHSLAKSRLEHWQHVPPENRIFIIGSAEDAPRVHKLQKDLEKADYATFFYDNCQPLCGSQVVGAFCKQAHSVLAMATLEADGSAYVSAEIAKAREIKGLAPAQVLMDPIDFISYVATSVVGKIMQQPSTPPAPGEPRFIARGLVFERAPCDSAKPDCL